jgi:hypothetical protein
MIAHGAKASKASKPFILAMWGRVFKGKVLRKCPYFEAGTLRVTVAAKRDG